MKCRKCGVELVENINWAPSETKRHQRICRLCQAAQCTAWRRKHGARPRRKTGDNKYGIPSTLPDGRHNPAYMTAQRRARGIGPRISGVSKWRVPHRLPDGTVNPEYDRVRRKSPEYRKMERVRRKRPEYRQLNTIIHNRRRRGLSADLVLGKIRRGRAGHHITKSVVVYIPQSLHRSVSHCVFDGKGMSKINRKVIRYYERLGKIEIVNQIKKELHLLPDEIASY